MKTINLSALKKNDEEYEKICSLVSEKYKGNWDDAVHESYARLIWEIKDYSRSVHNIRCKAEIIAKEVEELNIDEMKKMAEVLCREANSI